MDECPEGYSPIADAAGTIHCASNGGDPALFYVAVIFFVIIGTLWLASYIRRKRKPLTVNGWTLRKGFWEKD